MAASDAFIEVAGLYRAFRLGEVPVPVLKGVDLAIRRGELVALMGASGSGKTTLMNILGCLDRPSVGGYRLDSEETSTLTPVQLANIRSERIGFVFQNFSLLPRTSALENVLMPSVYSQSAEAWTDTLSRARQLLTAVGLDTRLDSIPSQLSGGEQQRVAIARALINRPRLLLADEPTGNLDSHTGRDILALFQRLNREYGITILLVTHDPNVAAIADRVIRIADGVIVADDRGTAAQGNGAASPHPALPPPQFKAHPGVRHRRTLRRLLALTGIALRTLRRNPMRTTLTMLGIVIGVAAVIAMIEISAGASRAVQLTVSNMGVANLVVTPGLMTRSGVSRGNAKTLTPADAIAIADHTDGVTSAAPVVHAQGQVVYGNKNWYARNIIGSTPAFFAVRDWAALAFGTSFDDRDARVGSQVCVIGQTLASKLFGDRYPVGEEVRVQNVPLRVIGLLSRKGANLLGADQDDILVTPLMTAKYRLRGQSIGGDKGVKAYDNLRRRPLDSAARGYRTDDINYIIVQTTGPAVLAATASRIGELLRDRHRLNGKEDDFQVHDNTELSNAFNRTVELLSSLGMSVAAVSLLVGGIGIMNIMLVSVTERTREIGIRMAVGATPSQIRNQFLIESVVLCLLGGAVGIAAGRTGSEVTGRLLGWPVEVSPTAAVIAVCVSLTVGIAFGYYPAWKASSLDPIQSLRFE